MKLKNIMLDLETMGNNSNSVIVSIGAVPFDIETGEFDRKLSFYEKIDIDSCLKAGLKVDGSTIYWWLNQSKKAQEELLLYKRPLSDVLTEFTNWINGIYALNNNKNDINIWGNGATFDIVILANAYRALDRNFPWNYHHERDVRTLVSFAPEIKDKVIKLTKILEHHPIDDCVLQIKYVSEIWNKLQKK